MDNFCQFKGGAKGGKGGGAYQQWFFSQKKKSILSNLKLIFFNILFKDLNNFATS